MTKIIKNPVAKILRTSAYRQQILKNKKKYDRKTQKKGGSDTSLSFFVTNCYLASV